MASATLFNSATFIAFSRKKFTPGWSRIYPRPTTPSPRRGEGGVRGFGLQSKYSDIRTPSSCPSPLWGEGTQLAACRFDLTTGDSAALSTLFYAPAAAEVSRTNSTSTPGRVLPSSDSKNAPPAVETWLRRPMTPATLSAATVSPPPAKLTSFFASVSSATASATATVPVSNGSTSKAPNGPFQTRVFERASTEMTCSMLRGPISRIMSVAPT